MNPMAAALLALTSTLAQLPPSPDTRPVAIGGLVVDAAGRPVADADAWLAEALSPDEDRQAGVEMSYSGLTRPGEGTPPILFHGRGDADGRLALELPAEAVARRSPPFLAVWAAVGQGRETRVGFRRLPRIVLADDPPARIELASATQAVLTILTPDRKPAAGARVAPTRFADLPIPEPLGRRLAATADAAARAVIVGLEPDFLGEVRVEADGYGIQILKIPDSRIPDPGPADQDGGPVLLAIAPAGRIDGRLEAPRGEPIRGATVRATSQVDGYSGSGIRGTATAACDEDGRFTIPAIAAGLVALELEFDPTRDFPLRGEAPQGLVVRAGQTVEVTIPLRETVRVRGVVREKGNDRPIAGVKVILNGYFGGDRFVVTGAEGRFAGRVLRDAGQPYGWPIRVPSPFFTPADQPELPQRMPPRDVAELERPPIDLRRGVDVRGTVADGDGKPVTGAEVEAIWHHAEVPSGSSLARTDRAGVFVLRGVDPVAELNLNAWDGSAASPTVAVRAAATGERPIALTLSPTHTVPIGGRVVDPAGRPIAGASVRIWRRVRDPRRAIALSDPVVAGDGPPSLHTGADGRFRARGRFPSGGEYDAEATAPGRLAAWSPVVAAARDADRPALLVLRRVLTVEGRVVDRRGRPIAGAVVRQSGDGPMPTRATAGADGRFRLPGVIEGPAVLYAEGAGFRPHYLPADDASRPVEVVLARDDEPPTVAYRTLPPASPVEEEKALARRLIEPLAGRVLASGDDAAKYEFFVDAAAIDPQDAIEWLGEARFGDPETADFVRQLVAESLARESLDDATAVLEASTDAGARAGGYIGLFDAAPGLAIERRRALLEQALLHCKTVSSLLHRFNGLGQIADRLIDLGDVDRARAVLRDAQELAGNLRKGDKDTDQCPLYIAVALSRLDLPAALKIVEDLRRDARKTISGDVSQIYERFYGRIAEKLADRDPAEAERVLGRLGIRPTSDRSIVAVCTRMAPRDLARAHRIAATRISPDGLTLRPYARGLMARAIAGSDRAEAARLLDEAFGELERLAASESRDRHPSAAMVAAGLLPVVERVAPDRLGEFLGRAALMRRARGDRTIAGGEARSEFTAQLALMVARYDRGLAARILEPPLEAFRSSDPGDGVDHAVLCALALIDPRRAVAMVEALPDDPAPGTDPDATKARARRSVARMLALHGDDRWRMVFQQFLFLWTPEERSW